MHPTSQDFSGETWYALQLFTKRQQEADTFFEEKGMETYIPKEYVRFEDGEGKQKSELRPVVRNLIFVKKTVAEKVFADMVRESNIPMKVFRKAHDATKFYEISSSEMREFQIMCNPEIELRKYLSADEARLKAGTKVVVEHGPLKGLSGKLVRQSHKYYLLKEVPGMGVMIKVSRWCCKPVVKP